MNRFILVMFCLIASSSFSQSYTTAAGLKGAYYFNGGAALNVKHFLGSNNAIEACLGGGSRHIWLQGLYERNNELTHGLEWYYGFGADLGVFTNGGYVAEYSSGLFMGVDGVVGIEYTFEVFPLNLALDTGPSLRLLPYVGFGWGGGFAARYAF